MSSVSGVGASSQIFAQIDQLNKVVAQASVDQIEFTTKLTKLAVEEAVTVQQQATATAALDKVV